MTADRPIQLIAHRGGVVDDRRPENSHAALAAAIERGYWMVEVDLRRTSDGVFILWHDEHIELDEARYPIEETSWERIRSRTDPELFDQHSDSGWEEGPGSTRRPPKLEEVLERYAGEIEFMIDVKNRDHPPEVYPALEDCLERYGQLRSTYFIGAPDASEYFRGTARTKVVSDLESRDEWEAAADRSQFLFAQGRELATEAVRRARTADLPVVASVNVHHYMDPTELSDPDMSAPRKDIERLLSEGVRTFQIDSALARFVTEP